MAFSCRSRMVLSEWLSMFLPRLAAAKLARDDEEEEEAEVEAEAEC